MPEPSPNPPTHLRRASETVLVTADAQESDTRRQMESAVREAVTRERRRLADLLHQTASQSLTAAYYSALVLTRKPSDAPGPTAELAALPDMIHTVIEELREITREFREGGDEAPPP